MMVICTMIRMLPGIWVRTRETARLENAVTAITARHITILTLMLVVTASAEQIPRICRAIGLLLKIGSKRTCLAVEPAMIRPPLHEVFSGTGRSRAHPSSSSQAALRRGWSVWHQTARQSCVPGLWCRSLRHLSPGESVARRGYRHKALYPPTAVSSVGCPLRHPGPVFRHERRNQGLRWCSDRLQARRSHTG